MSNPEDCLKTKPGSIDFKIALGEIIYTPKLVDRTKKNANRRKQLRQLNKAHNAALNKIKVLEEELKKYKQEVFYIIQESKVSIEDLLKWNIKE